MGLDRRHAGLPACPTEGAPRGCVSRIAVPKQTQFPEGQDSSLQIAPPRCLVATAGCGGTRAPLRGQLAGGAEHSECTNWSEQPVDRAQDARVLGALGHRFVIRPLLHVELLLSPCAWPERHFSGFGGPRGCHMSLGLLVTSCPTSLSVAVSMPLPAQHPCCPTMHPVGSASQLLGGPSAWMATGLTQDCPVPAKNPHHPRVLPCVEVPFYMSAAGPAPRSASTQLGIATRLCCPRD